MKLLKLFHRKFRLRILFDKNIAFSVQFLIQHEFQVMNEAEGSMIPGEVSVTFDRKSIEMCNVPLLAICTVSTKYPSLFQQNSEPCFDLTHLDWTKEEGGSGGPGWTGVYLPLQ